MASYLHISNIHGDPTLLRYEPFKRILGVPKLLTLQRNIEIYNILT